MPLSITALLVLLLTVPLLHAAEPTGPTSPGYQYYAELDRVVDGDTVILDVDLGFGVWMHGVELALHGLDAPEMRGDIDDETRQLGTAARDWLDDQLAGVELIIRTFKGVEGAPERWQVEIFVEGESINRQMLASGHATPAP